MFSTMGGLFIKMAGTVSVVIVIAFLAGGSDLSTRLDKPGSRLRYEVLPGIMGGLFGIYGNLTGVNLDGAVISVRDVGPMMAGFIGGPLGGIIAGVIAGAHRLLLGGITAHACIIATCLIGLICGIVGYRRREVGLKPSQAFLLGVCMETMHLCIVLLIVKPFSVAWGIIEQMFLPFILINAVGFTLLVFTMNSISRRRELEAERGKLKSELEVSARIQQSLLPVITPKFPGREEVSLACSMNAAKDVGGDFYDFFFVDKDRLAIVIADVSGKGIPAALFMVNAKTVLQNCVRDIPSLSEAMNQANATLCANNEAEMFVTAWIGVLELKTGVITYVNAGHNPPVIMKPAATVFLKGKHGIILAEFEEYKYVDQCTKLQPGDSLYLYTDGVTEAVNTALEQYGDDRLLSDLRDSMEMDPPEVLERVKANLKTFTGEADQFDDETMVCLKYLGPERLGLQAEQE